MKEFQFLLVLGIAALTACSGPKVTLAPILKQASHRIAILNFASSGFLGSQKQGKFVADELAKNLLLKHKALVVDRSIVNTTTRRLGITSSDFMTQGQLLGVAEALNVQIIILGDVRNIAKPIERFSEGKAHFMISYRLVDPHSGTATGLISHEREGTGAEEKLIREMIEEMVDAMEGLQIDSRFVNAGNGAPEPGANANGQSGNKIKPAANGIGHKANQKGKGATKQHP